MNSALIFVLFYGLVPLATAVLAYYVIKRNYPGDDK
jgi:hypothetical protein